MDLLGAIVDLGRVFAAAAQLVYERASRTVPDQLLRARRAERAPSAPMICAFQNRFCGLRTLDPSLQSTGGLWEAWQADGKNASFLFPILLILVQECKIWHHI